MKTKKYLSVLVSVGLIWLMIALSEKITSDIYSIIMYIAFGLILIALFAYQTALRISVMNTLLNKMNPVKFLNDFQELDGSKYSASRYILEAFACILLGDFFKAETLLKNVNKKKDNELKAAALSLLCYYFSGNTVNAKATVIDIKSCISSQPEKYNNYLYFAMLIDALMSGEVVDTQICEKYFNSIKKKNFAEVYVANYIIGEAKLMLNDTENALMIFENIEKSNCNNTILYTKSVVKINEIKNQETSR